jgi:hypothetical protein
MFVPLAPAAQNLGVGLPRLLKLDLYYPFVCGATRAGGVRCHQSPPVIQSGRSHNFTFSVAAVLPTPPVVRRLRAPHRGTPLGPLVCGAKKIPMVFPSTCRSEARRYRLKPLFLLSTDSIVPSSMAAPLVEGGQSGYVLSSLVFFCTKSAEKDPLTLY